MVSKPCEHSGIACRPAKCAGTCDFSSLALLFGQVLFGNIYAFFWQNVAIYVLFCKNIDIDAIFWQNVAIYALFSRFRPNSKIIPSSAFNFFSPLAPKRGCFALNVMLSLALTTLMRSERAKCYHLLRFHLH